MYNETSTPDKMIKLDDFYHVGGSDKIKSMEEELSKELSDLKLDIEENEMLAGAPRVASSLSLPRDIEHFRQERKHVIERGFQVYEAHPIVIQADVLTEEAENCMKEEYTEKSLPLILHQFFCDRIQQLVQCKHMHMLRWKRFCSHTSTLEAVYPMYQKRLALIMSEYNDAIARAKRLAVAKDDLYSSKQAIAAGLVTLADIQIYTRWLTCHLHSIKKIHSYLKVLEWVSVSHKHEIVPTPTSQITEEVSKAEMPDSSRSAYTARSEHRKSSLGDAFFRRTSLASRPGSAASGPTAPLSASVNLISTHTVPANVSGSILAASGGGLVSNEATQGIPTHVTDLESLKPVLEFLMACYGIQMDINQISTSANEMELVANVNRKFRAAFAKQEQQRTFPTYDKIELGMETWGADSPAQALKKESNWLPFIKVKPEADPHQVKMLTNLRQRGNIDELLKAQSRFLTVTDSSKVQDALKDHAVAVRDPPVAQPISVTSYRSSSNTNAIWRKIYLNSNLYSGTTKEEDMTIVEFDEKDVDSVNYSGRLGSAGGRKRRDSDEYNYFNAMQMLGLDDDDEGHQDPTMIQGGYLSFLNLRHLRIRDLQRTCLSILNYFRSVERTLTINDGGLSLENGHQKKTSQNHRVGVREGGQDGGGGLGSHHYLHYTPADYKISEAEFMEFSEVENHDDFYTLEDGRVHVQDQRGYYIIYDAAMKDLENLEKDLLLIATHFIEKDKDHRSVGSASTRRSDSARKRQSQAAGDVDMPVYGHQQVDRFAVLMDLWTSEADYLENKRQLLDCYLEAYHNVFDMQEKRQLAQVITNTMYQRPRFDFDASYFVKTYRAECICLRLHSSLIKSILDKQIAEQREYIQKMTREGDSDFGLPHEIVPKQLVALNLSRPALKHVYMLEFHPSLAMGSRLPVCLKRAYFDLVHTHQPRSVTEAVSMEKKLLEVSLSQWEKLDRPGNSYSSQVQKDVFQDVFAEDPLFICEIGSSLFKTKDMAAGKRSKKEKQADLLAIWTRLLETITIRHRLIDAAWETEILSKLYKKHAFEMGFDEYHLFLRYVQFEFASFKDKADQPPPVFITALLEDDSSVDRYVPSTLLLAIQEIDEKHVGMFTFRNRDGFVKMIEGSGLENLRIALQCQVVHKNALLSAVQQASVCSYFQEVSPAVDNGMSGRKSPSDARSEKSSMTALTTTGPQTTNIQSMASSVVFASKLKTGMERQKRSPESFVSLQLEKVPSRDIILNEFLKKKQSMGTLMKSIEEVEKLKRSLIDKFCHHYQRRMSQYSLRGQIIAYLNSTMALLEEFPTTKQTHFIIGRPGEKKTEEDDKKGLLTDPRILHKRPRRILSQDGSMLLNLWFLPHHSEVLIMFKTLDNDTCIRALRLTLQLVAALHDILHYLCSYSRLGSSNARLGSKRMETADWGGTEGISAELRGIQKQIDNLDNPTNPQEVADFLTLRRDVMFLEFDTSVRHAMCDTFLSTNNVSAFRSITDNMHTALTSLSNAQVPSVYAISMPIPEPFEARDFPAQQLTPWRAFISRRGPFPTQFWDFRQIEYNMQLCLAGLRDVDRHVANGEILGVSLQMEDVLQTCQPDELYTNMDVESDDENGEKGTAKGGTTPRAEEQQPVEEKEKEVSHQPATKKPISRSKEPIKAYGLLKKFLILWKILEVFKKEWARRKIQDEDVSTASAFRKYCKVYKTEILYPVVKSIARKYGQGEIYEGMIREDEPVPAPKGASEMEIRAKQLIRLLDHLEAFMILELRKKIAKEHTLVVSERGREEGNLPTDLWKKPVINERMTIAKPHIAEDFSRMLMSEATQSGDDIIIKREALNKSLSMLANLVMQRERSNYESYSMYYENLLRHHHQLLYQREQEIKKLQDTSKDTGASGLVEVQCQLADRSHELILEITALRAKIAEMRELALTMETDIRERVKEEYRDLVQNLFSAAFTLKTRFDEFRNQLYDDMFNSIGDVRREAVMTMSKLKSKQGGMEEEDALQRNLRKNEELSRITHDNNQLNRLVLKMKMMNNWKRTHLREFYESEVFRLQQEADRCKKESLEIQMMAEEDVILLRQELLAMKKALANSEKARELIQKQQEKESRQKKELEHKVEQAARSAKQLEHARASNLEKLMERLEDKDVRLKTLSSEQEKNMKMNQIMQNKVRKDMGQMKKQLSHERSMKLDAFQRIDELQTQVYDYEVDYQLPSRPHTAGTVRTTRTTKSSRPSTGFWPPAIGFPPNYNRSLTPDPWPKEGDSDRVTQRPKTVNGRLRSQITEQLVHDMEPHQHETIMQLLALEKTKTQKVGQK
ncbi:uncharacterized protein [Ptychodera flava]|uniref:uncharacterized protein isoform X2 n=2 Tax=Ptychodera flava TaxID=63121 RepID=UPI00396A2A53